MGLKLIKNALIKKGMLKPKEKPSKKRGILETWKNIENMEPQKGMPRKKALKRAVGKVSRFPFSNGGLVKYKNVSKIK
tara:strand:- start:48 stop:281 length:234 start_codon:yes stop_codon:yes gene_type:complete